VLVRQSARVAGRQPPAAIAALRFDDFDFAHVFCRTIFVMISTCHHKCSRGELMRLKRYCIDNRLLPTVSANFSRSGETRQDNDLVAPHAPSVCAAFERSLSASGGGLTTCDREVREPWPKGSRKVPSAPDALCSNSLPENSPLR
jgi:hypothetical protein